MMHDVYFCKILLQFSKQQKCFGLKSSSKNVSNYWGGLFLKIAHHQVESTKRQQKCLGSIQKSNHFLLKRNFSIVDHHFVE